MNQNILLSICVPTYNRSKKFSKFLNSIDTDDNIEVVIVDDGSTEDIKSLLLPTYKFKLKYYKNEKNKGRSSALYDAINLASGKYVMIMDSDDYFISGGIEKVLNQIKENNDVKTFVFGTEIIKNGKKILNKPPKKLWTNLIKLRADYGIKGDLKEVVRKEYIQRSLYKKSYNFRFSPTSLIWSKLSEISSCYTIDECIATKTYLSDGISASISKIKFDNAEAFCDLFENNSKLNLYNSLIYRLKNKIQYYRYLFASNKNLSFKFSQILLILIGYFLFKLDKSKYSKNYKKI